MWPKLITRCVSWQFDSSFTCIMRKPIFYSFFLIECDCESFFFSCASYRLHSSICAVCVSHTCKFNFKINQTKPNKTPTHTLGLQMKNVNGFSLSLSSSFFAFMQNINCRIAFQIKCQTKEHWSHWIFECIWFFFRVCVFLCHTLSLPVFATKSMDVYENCLAIQLLTKPKIRYVHT